MYMTCDSWDNADVIRVQTEEGDFIWEEPYKGKATEQAHKKVVARAIKDYYDRYSPRGGTKMKVVGQAVGIGHYMWIVVITRRTTRTRA